MLHEFASLAAFSFLALFPILNPPAMAPIFLDMTSALPDEDRHHLAWLIGKYTFMLLFCVLVAGGWLLKIFGISVPVIRIAGGLLLFNTAWQMLNNEARFSQAEQEELKTKMTARAFFPMTMPVTAGPGSIAVTLTLVPAGSLLNSYTWLKFAADAAGIALAALSVFFFYRYSENLLRRLGRAGAQTISKISAFILLAIGVQIIWDGIRGLLGLS
ncbi:MAG: antibiotic resistance protein MarC [Elusimicrobia bacterium HGW-Elusimicrobia-3]|nr:MAG: antibiotic resistance protein MarC [Elusimicrobia bacterium HGW-Elusimicrobia-3]